MPDGSLSLAEYPAVMARLLIAAAVLLASTAVTNADQHWRPTESQLEILELPGPAILRRLGEIVESAPAILRRLGEIVESAPDNYRCRAKAFRRLGLSPAEGELYYLVRCADSERYTIRVRRDATGTTGVMSCTFLETLNINCDAMSPASYLHPFR
jgi:hypothetical protein